MKDDLQKRYDLFCQDAEEFLDYAGYGESNMKPRIIGKALLSALNALASMHLPEDTEVNGIGPRGLIWGMYDAFPEKEKDHLPGSLALVKVVRFIIKRRPPIQFDKQRGNFSHSRGMMGEEAN